MLNNYTFFKLLERKINSKIDELKKENGYNLLRYVFAPACILLSRLQPFSFKYNDIYYTFSTNYWQLFFILLGLFSILISFSFVRTLFLEILLKLGVDLYNKKFGLSFQKSIDTFNFESALLLKDVQLFNDMLNKTKEENIELFVYSIHADLFQILDTLGVFQLKVTTHTNNKNKDKDKPELQSAIISFNRVHCLLDSIFVKLKSKSDNMSSDGAKKYFTDLLSEFSQLRKL
jgi:hypothetical protein